MPALALIALLSLLWWAFVAFGVVRTVRAVPLLDRLQRPAPRRWPRVSIVIPACNEAGQVEHAVRTRLADTYPDLEIILVDDRSTDETGAIVDRIAADDPRVRAVHVRSLPPDWLGKVHALHTGARLATGEWLLFSDADVQFVPGTLREAIAYAEADGIDHVTALPAFLRSGFWLDCAYATFLRSISVAGRLWSVSDPRSDASAGSGVFSLVRRDVFAATPGFEHLRLEVGDDVALGPMLKEHGARPRVVNARNRLALSFYPSVGEMFRGMEKNQLAIIGQFSYVRLIAFACVATVLENGVFAAALWPPPRVGSTRRGARHRHRSGRDSRVLALDADANRPVAARSGRHRVARGRSAPIGMGHVSPTGNRVAWDALSDSSARGRTPPEAPVVTDRAEEARSLASAATASDR